MRSYDYTISIGHLGEQLTLNQWVLGSSPRWCTKKRLAGKQGAFLMSALTGDLYPVHHRGREQLGPAAHSGGQKRSSGPFLERGSLRSLISWQGGCCPGLPHQRQPYTVCRAVFLLLHPGVLRPSRCTIGDENSTSGRSASRPVPTVQWTVGKCAGPSVA